MIFKPTEAQALAKATFLNRLEGLRGLTDATSLGLPRVVELSGNRHTATWLKDPEFEAWFYDKVSLQTRLQAMREVVVDRLHEILGNPVEDPKVVLKAADMVMQLTGTYPAKQREIRYIDPDLNEMPEDEAQRQLTELRGKLQALPSNDLTD